MREDPAEPLVPGLLADYYSDSYECWVPARVERVDQETGAVEVDARKLPLAWTEARQLLRPRTQPGRKELQWIAKVLRTGRVQTEARSLFKRHATASGCDDQPGPAVLKAGAFQGAGADVDGVLGVSGSAYELSRRLAKELRGQRAALPPGWQACRSAATGRAYYCSGGRAQWRPPAGAGLELEAFQAAFWEMLDAVHRRWGQALSVPGRVLRPGGELRKDYNFGKPPRALGEGSFGKVFLAKDKKTGLLRAVKEMQTSTEEAPDVLDSEVGRLCLLDHPNIVKLYSCYRHGELVWIVMDYCSGGSLKTCITHLRSKRRLMAEATVASTVRQLLLAVAHVHARGLLHLDIKPDNVLMMPELGTLPPSSGPDPETTASGIPDLSKPIHLMLIDLGLSRAFRPGDFKGNSPRGTPLTMAPEVWRGIETPAADIFSCGCTFFYLTAQAYPFRGLPQDTRSQDMRNWWAACPARFENEHAGSYSLECQALCDRMLHRKRLRRPSAPQCLRDAFLAPGRCAEASEPQVCQRLQRLAKAPDRSVLYRSVALAVAAAWPAHRLPTTRSAFERLDVAGTGRLHRSQIQEALVSLGVEEELARNAADAADLSRNGMVDWTEFVAACVHLSSDALKEDLWQLFQEADRDHDGLLDRKDLSKLLATRHARREDVDNVMLDLVGSTDAKVDWPTFRRHFKSIAADREEALPGRAR